MTPLDLPVGVPEGAATLALLERIAAAVEATGDKSAEASQKTETAWERAQAKITAAADAFNETREAVSGFAEMVGAAAERLVTSASNAERMERAQLQLGLSFEQAASAAGGYVNQVELATAAQTLAERGIRLHQDELNGLARVAQNYARTSGKEFAEAMEMVTEVVTEGGEEMGKLDTALLAVADTAKFTAEDRLGALVDRAREIAPAARTAAEEMHAFQGALEQAEQAFAHGFVESLASFRQGTGDAVDKLKELKDEMHAAGMVAGEILTRAGAGLQLLVGGLVAGLGAVVSGLSAAGVGILALLNRQNVGAAMEAEFRRAMTTGFLGEVTSGLMEQIDRLEAIDNDRTSMAAPSVGGTRADVNRDDAARHARQGSSSSSSSATARGADMTFSQDEATYGADGLADRAREQGERGLRAREAQERAASEARERSQMDALIARERAEQDRVKAREREQDDQAKRLANLQTFTEQWRQLHSEQVNVAASAAGSLNTVLGDLGSSLAKHWEAVVDGQETLGAALQGILGDVLDSMAKECFAKGGFYFAEGLARLVMYDAPGALTSFGASAAYFTAGSVASALGAQVSAPAQPSAAGAAAAPSRADTFARPANDNASGGGQTVVNHYYAPIIGGRDALDSEVGERMGRYQDAAASRQVRDRGGASRRAA